MAVRRLGAEEADATRVQNNNGDEVIIYDIPYSREYLNTYSSWCDAQPRHREVRPKKIKNGLQDKIRSTNAYQIWRHEVFERDCYACQECAQGARIDAHHIRSLSQLIEDYSIRSVALDCAALWDVTNGQTLCRVCHHKVHRG